MGTAESGGVRGISCFAVGRHEDHEERRSIGKGRRVECMEYDEEGV